MVDNFGRLEFKDDIGIDQVLDGYTMKDDLDSLKVCFELKFANINTLIIGQDDSIESIPKTLDPSSL